MNRRLLLRALAAVFLTATTVHTVAWLYGIRRPLTSYLGVDYDAVAEPSFALVVRSVATDSPAERAGLRRDDRLVGVDGQPLESPVAFLRAVGYRRPGEHVSLTVERIGQSGRLALDARLESRPPDAPRPVAARVASEMTRAYPILFYLGLLLVLVLRLDDTHAWWLALLFAVFIAGAPVPDAALPPFLSEISVAYSVLFSGAAGGIVLFFFSIFPEPSPLDRRAPWLKWLWLATGLSMSVALAAVRCFFGAWAPALRLLERIHLPLVGTVTAHAYIGYGLGLLSLLWNGIGGGPPVRRKLRVIVWGAFLGIGPVLVVFGVARRLQVDPFNSPLWLWAPVVIATWLLPLSFLYAVLRHRVLEIPALLRLSARYLLVQRGSVVFLLLIGIATAILFSASFGQRLAPSRQPLAVGFGIAFGTLLIWIGSHLQRRVRERIDRAFFRAAYDARRILEDLTENARAASRRDDLVKLIEGHVRSALFPVKFIAYIESGDGTLAVAGGDRAPTDPQTLSPSSRLLSELARRGQAMELASGSGREEPWLSGLGVECLVPILGHQGRLRGLLALGPRRSDEPYSREDKRLLAAVAGQAGTALENIRLAEEIAQRLETERLAAHELELAHRVQSKLLPQEAPVLSTLELGGRCVQARTVGGDYFDFLELGEGRLGLVLADISGKGFSAALLMASLQASLRSRSAADLLDLPRQLQAVHQLLLRSSESDRFATLFLGVYGDATRRLTYANCGHNPPLLLRADGRVERLEPTGPVLGLFSSFECVTSERVLGPGDLLAVYSDGITETFDPSGVEFGENRLQGLLETYRQSPVAILIDRVLDRVRDFGQGEQQDDQTLLIARAR